MQYVYEPEEVDRIARGQKPHTIECDSAGRPIEVGKATSKFFKGLKIVVHSIPECIDY